MSWKWPFERTSDMHRGRHLCAIFIVRRGKEELWKTRVHDDEVVGLVCSLWNNNQPLDEVWSVNMFTGAKMSFTFREVKPIQQCPECNGRGPGYCPVCKRKKT